ncbi:MAG: hypothetical protein H7Y30_05455 [Pyrinomonadaceae bacterium]|nr:hypothetical protein [Pyrinomonadaceae bacterium]
MPKSSTTKSAKKRTQVKDLPKKEKKLSAGEMKKVKGGLGDTGTHEVGHVKPKPKTPGFGGDEQW